MMNYRQQFEQNMRRSVYALAVMISVVYFSGCDGSDDPGTQDLFMNKLKGTWTLSTGKVTVNKVDVTGAFKGLVITFDNNMHFDVADPAAPLWPEAGTFALQPSNHDALFNIVRDDNVVVSVKALTATTITLALQYSPPGAPVKSVGHYEFQMSR